MSKEYWFNDNGELMPCPYEERKPMTKKIGLPKVHINTVKGSLIDNHHMECEPIFMNGYFITRTQVEIILDVVREHRMVLAMQFPEEEKQGDLLSGVNAAIKILEGE